MNLYKQLLLIVFSISTIFLNSQQYDAPALKCVQNTGTSNILTWQTPSVGCGSFIKYYIYVSNSKSGPYTILDSITTESNTSYIHQNIDGSKNYFYYMTSSYSCAGETSKNSDTISDILFPRPELISLSIENGNIVYKWKPMLDMKNAWAYYVAIVGERIVDTVIGRWNDTYTDTSTDPNNGPYYAYVGVTDSCGGARGRSPWSYAQKTSFLSSNNNPCEGNVALSWTPYVGWTQNDEVYAYDIMVTINSDPEKSIARLGTDEFNYVFSDYAYGDTVSIRIRSIHPSDTNVISHSNVYSFISKKSQKPLNFNTLSASHLNDSTVEIYFYCDPSSNPKFFGLRKLISKSKTIISEMDKMPFDTIGDGIYRMIDSNANIDRQINYQVLFIDLCDQASESSFSKDNYLSATQHGLFSNKLDWSNIFFSDTFNYTILGYSVYMSEDEGSFNKIADIDKSENSYIHNVEDLINGKGLFCYKVIARYEVDTPSYIEKKTFEISSNNSCVTMRTVFWMPNAFKVDGYTPTFKPKIVYRDMNSSFEMIIIDRWGNEIFRTSDPYTGWNGVNSNGIESPEDTYFYKAIYLGNDGLEITKTGSFLLLR